MLLVQPATTTGLVSRFGPANIVTFARALLSGVVAVLVVAAYAGSDHRTTLVAVGTVALVLDWVDGQVARRTHAESAFGARFDMEVDAFLILVLSTLWPAFSALGPRHRPRPLPAPGRRAGVAVAAPARAPALLGQGRGGAAGHRPHGRRSRRPPPRRHDALVVVALALLAESFSRQVWWLWRTRNGAIVETRFEAPVTALAVVLVWAALTLPNRVQDLGPAVFVRLPLEALVLLALAVVLPARLRNATALLVGVVLALTTVARALDMGFFFALNRPFDPVIDWTYAGSLVGLLRDSLGGPTAILLLTLATAVIVVLLVLVPLALRRLAALAARHRRSSLRAVAALAVVWALAAALGLHVERLTPAVSTDPPRFAPFASTSTAAYAYTEISRIPVELQDQREFASNT